MGIPFTRGMGFLLTATMGKLFTMTMGIQLTISNLTRSCPVLFYETVAKEEAGRERLVRLACGMRKVRLPDRRKN